MHLTDLSEAVSDLAAEWDGVREWAGIAPDSISTSASFQRLLDTVDGLRPAFTCVREIAELTGRTDAFARVVKHTIRCLLYSKMQTIPVPFTQAARDPRGLWRIAESGDREGTEAALQVFAQMWQDVDTDLQGAIELLLVWHDFVKAIGERATQNKRCVDFIESLALLSQVEGAAECILSQSEIQAAILLAIEYGIVADVSYQPSKFDHAGFAFWCAARRRCPALIEQTPKRVLLGKFLTVYGLLDVAGLRDRSGGDRGELRHPDHIFAMRDVRLQLEERLTWLEEQRCRGCKDAEIVARLLHDRDRNTYAWQRLLSLLSPDLPEKQQPASLAVLRKIASGVSTESWAAFEHTLSRVTEFRYLEWPLTNLSAVRPDLGMAFLMEICGFLDTLPECNESVYFAIALAQDYVRVGDEQALQRFIDRFSDKQEIHVFAFRPVRVSLDAFLVTVIYNL